MKRWHRILTISAVCFTLAACNDTLSSVSNKVEHPLPTKVVNRMKAYDMTQNSPIMMRVFKEESVLEVWKAKSSGRYEKIAEYEICKWSGALGPKQQEGDRQAPEGFYTVGRHQMNPNSSYYLSFNLGYPNKFDRSHERTGSNLMVHGACSSAGCYSMTDESVLEIYAFAREAFRGGQESFQVQAFPFRMTAENMARHRDNANYEFWKMLKVGYDHFELTKTPPKVDVCDRKYVFNQFSDEEDAIFDAKATCPATRTPDALAMAYASYQQDYQTSFNEEIVKLTAAQSNAASPAFSRLLGSRPDAAATIPVRPATATPPLTTQPLSTPITDMQTITEDAAAANPPVSGFVAPEADADSPFTPAPAAIPVPQPNPLQTASLVAQPTSTPAPRDATRRAVSAPAPSDKPFWKVWSSN